LKKLNLEEMFKGWFVGNFTPTAYKTSNCEVAVKKYNKGDYEPPHYHKIATEITLILTGNVKMKDREWSAGDIVIIEPGDVTDFLALSETINVVVKVPGASNDKFTCE
jgi:quercetin dioxygenase-like cupin family protein